MWRRPQAVGTCRSEQTGSTHEYPHRHRVFLRPPAAPSAATDGDAGLREEAVTLLRRLVGRDDVDFHEGQCEAMRALVAERRRALVVQRTGWGKSAVYFVATALLRARGAGPTAHRLARCSP